MVGLLATHVAGGQTIALIGENDSLIIRKKLNEVVVSADQIDDPNAEDAKLSYSENIDELLENKQGISLTRRGNYASEIVLRGMSSERLGSTINGMKIFSACTDKMDPVSSYVSANNLNTVDIDHDGHGKCFGSNTGGQVNFNTKEAVINDSKKIRSSLTGGVNSSSMGLQTSFNSNYSEKTWALRLNAMAAKHENYRAGGGQEIAHSQYEKMNFGLSFKSKLSEKDFLLLDFIADDARNVGYPALPMDVAFAKANIYSLTYRRFFGGTWGGKINAKIYGNNVRHLMDDGQRNVVMRMDMPGYSDTYGLYVLTEMNQRNNHQFSFNFDGYTNRSLAEMTMYPENENEMYMLTWPDVNRIMYGFFASDIYTLKNEDEVSLSGRIDLGQSEIMSDLGKRQFEIFGYEVDKPFYHQLLATSLSYNKKIKEGQAINLELAYAERLPSISEQFAFYIFNSQDGYDYLGQPDILKEKAFKSELSYRKKGKKTSMQTTAFAYHMPDYILGIVDPAVDGMTIGSKGVKRYVNIKFAQMCGAELGFTWQVIKSLKFGTDFTYTLGRDNENKALPLIPPLRNISELVFKVKKQLISLKMTAANSQNRYSILAGENATPAYTLLDFNYQRAFKLGEKELNIITGVLNIFDKNYHDHMDWNDIPRAGRNIFIKFQFQF